MTWLKSKKTVAVHSGNFHADDVFCVALLSILYKGNIKVIRTRDKEEYAKADFVVDVGLEYKPEENKFDHHQEGGAGVRDSKIVYSAFGLLWKKYGEEVCGTKKVSDILNKKLVAVVDADDCGFDLCKDTVTDVKPYLFTDAIYALQPTWREDNSSVDERFMQAVDLAKGTLQREIQITKDKLEAEVAIDSIYQNSPDKRIIIFGDFYLPKSLLIKYPEPLLVVYKERYGERWRVTTIEVSEGSFESRKNFPEAWWGKVGEEFVKISGIPQAVFCRNGGVFAGATTKEGAIKLAQIALEK